MPKLNEYQIFRRLEGRLSQLKANEKVETRKLGQLLTEEQRLELQEKIAEAKQGGVKERDVQIEYITLLLNRLEVSLVGVLEKVQLKKEVARSNVFFRTYGHAIKKLKKDPYSALLSAQSAAGMKRSDELSFNRGLTERDQEIQQIEDQLRKRLESELAEEDRQQSEYDKESLELASGKKSKK